MRMKHIVLAGEQWQARALLRAQLIEEGYEVEAHETVAGALATLAQVRTLPALVIADVAESEDPSADLDNLSAWTKLVPVWLLASRSMLKEEEAREAGIERIFFRPVDLAGLIAAIQEITGGPQ